ncbi:MAG: diguanylate cyclase domain-containing protein [Anaerobutyricum hallii]
MLRKEEDSAARNQKEKTLLYPIAVFRVELEEQVSKKEPGFFIFIDVDNFKSYNDTYGHNNGDLCLQTLHQSNAGMFPGRKYA